MKLYDLRTEYQKNPIGLDVQPRFSWKIESDDSEVYQQSRRIVVQDGTKKIWDSGIVTDDISVLVPYKGQNLSPMTEYKVTVTVTDNHGNSAETSGTFETGLLKQKNWKACWISDPFSLQEKACSLYRYSFEVSGDVQSARIYATALGVYEIQVNGEKAGDAFMAPGWTSYQKRLQYQTYDVTALLKEQNNMQITVGNGWYKGYLNCEGKNCFYGEKTAVLAMLVVTYEDGHRQIIGTDECWRVTTGVIRSAEIYHGETQDFTWNEQEEKEAVLYDFQEEGIEITAQESEPVRVTKRFPAKKKIITPKGEIVLDFGQNMAGLVEVVLPETLKGTLVIKHAEILDRDGNFYMENLRTAKCTDIYIYGNEMVGKKVMPHFTYHGFRYIMLEGVSQEVDASRFTACALHTDMEQLAHFHSSNDMLNQLMSNIEWGQRSNFFDIPTDCPQRDERLY